MDGKQTKNIIDYAENNLKSFGEHSFSAVDSLVLSQFCYMNFEGMVPHITAKKTPVLLRSLFRAENFRQMTQKVWDPTACIRLLTALSSSPRFRDIGVNYYVDRLDGNEEKQFSAVTFMLGDDSAYIAFRGTDTTVVGWKEDFNMAFMSPIPSQIDAVDYLNAVGKKLSKLPLRVGGHSKGGNLAVYASMESSQTVSRRITAVFSHDGPGFRAGVFQTDDYHKLKARIFKTMPASSIIGMLLENQEDYRVVESHRFGILQHDPFSWKVENGDFVDAKRLSPSVLAASEAIRTWLNELPREERERFVDGLFSVIESTGAETFYDLTEDWHKEAASILSAIKNLNPETGRFLLQTLKALVHTAVRGIRLPQLPELPMLSKDKSDGRKKP